MPNKIADDRRRVVYLEDKDKWEILNEAAKKAGISPSALIRAATLQLCNKIQKDPHFRIILPVFE